MAPSDDFADFTSSESAMPSDEFGDKSRQEHDRLLVVLLLQLFYGSEPSDLSGCIPRSFAVTLQRWVEFVRHEDRREDHSMSGVLREGEQTIARAAPSTVAVGFVSGPNSADGRQSSRRANGLEMKCFNEDGLNVDRRCTKRHPNQRRGAN